ncbi:MAG: choice-of-anchor tandem repeat GloVer-containing protein [Candidatus Korobacteraceae bacterium]
MTHSGGGWTETVLYSAQPGEDGNNPLGGVVFDRSGNLYGVFWEGGLCDVGAVYQLSPLGSSWTEQTLYGFPCSGDDGLYPTGGLIIDQSGNLYGTTLESGSSGGGTVFELTPANGGWTFNTQYSFLGNVGPEAKLIMDAAGNLYGTTYYDGAYGAGSVFKLTPSNGGWTYTSLHDFSAGSDGALPVSNVVFDANGDLYGTASYGGGYGHGVVWEITP